MYLLDSDILTYLFAGNLGVVRRAHNAERRVGTTIISKAELLRGRIEYLLKSDQPVRFLHAQMLFESTERDLRSLYIAPLTEPSLYAFAFLTKRKGLKKIGRADLLIAAIALTHSAVLVTRNLRHFGLIPELETENWYE